MRTKRGRKSQHELPVSENTARGYVLTPNSFAYYAPDTVKSTIKKKFTLEMAMKATVEV